MTDKTCTTCGRAISMERGLPDNEYWESRASSNVFCKATGIMMATADCTPLCQGRFWIEKQEEQTCRWSWYEEWRDDEYAGHECQYAGWGLNCGCFDEPLDEYDNPDVKPDNDWKFCPYCGAEVVDDDR